jgi:hypothetical protein
MLMMVLWSHLPSTKDAVHGASLYYHSSFDQSSVHTSLEQYHLGAPTNSVRRIDLISILSASAVPAAERCWMYVFDFNESWLALILCHM